MVATLTLADDTAEAVIVPGLGAGLASYDWVRGGGRTPLFRRCENPAEAVPFDLALNPLVPWSGRISGGGFRFAGRFHTLAPTLAAEKLPIHGDGFLLPWDVVIAEPARATLALAPHRLGPYEYEARLTYELVHGALRVVLEATHRGPDPLPYGLGVHPWLPRTPGTRLHAPASRVTLEDSRHLPAGELPVASRPDWDFSQPRRLPGAWINNEFAPWPGRATIFWDDRDAALEIDASGDAHLRRYILYSPASDAPFFCFEPVTHAIDAHNAADVSAAGGLVVLERDATLRIECCFALRRP